MSDETNSQETSEANSIVTDDIPDTQSLSVEFNTNVVIDNDDDETEESSENNGLSSLEVLDDHFQTPQIPSERLGRQVSDEESTYRHRQLSMLVAEEEESEYVTSAAWRDQEHHIFVLTEAGKPVYSRHGSEEKLSSVMGVMLAIVSCVQDRNDAIRSIHAGDHKFVFLVKMPLILVGVFSTTESVSQILCELDYVYYTIISVVTLSQLDRIYTKQKNFDLRRLLSGTDKFLDHLCFSMDSDPQYMLGAVQCFPMQGTLRDLIGQALQQAKSNDLAFAVLVCNGQVVNLCRLKECKFDTGDIQILLNLVTASTSFNDGETWLPICLPHFNPNGFLHAHISYLDENRQICLLLLSADQDAFFRVSECKQKVLTKLKRHDCLSALRTAARTKNSYTAAKLGIPDLRHFMYKVKSLEQFTCPVFSTPYDDEAQRARLFGCYQKLHGKIHDPDVPLRLRYCVTDDETLLAWVASDFELYAAFSPLITKAQAISAIDRLLRWERSNEDELFMQRPPTF